MNGTEEAALLTDWENSGPAPAAPVFGLLAIFLTPIAIGCFFFAERMLQQVSLPHELDNAVTLGAALAPIAPVLVTGVARWRRERWAVAAQLAATLCLLVFAFAVLMHFGSGILKLLGQ